MNYGKLKAVKYQHTRNNDSFVYSVCFTSLKIQYSKFLLNVGNGIVETGSHTTDTCVHMQGPQPGCNRLF